MGFELANLLILTICPPPPQGGCFPPGISAPWTQQLRCFQSTNLFNNRNIASDRVKFDICNNTSKWQEYKCRQYIFYNTVHVFFSLHNDLVLCFGALEASGWVFKASQKHSGGSRVHWKGAKLLK